jgi:hypothetical protein
MRKQKRRDAEHFIVEPPAEFGVRPDGSVHVEHRTRRGQGIVRRVLQSGKRERSKR